MEINESKSFTIYSKKFWNKTEVKIESQEEYKFHRAGKWKDFFSETDADGYVSWYMSSYNCMKRSKNNKWFSLIGSIDKNNDFLIGKENKIVFQQSGKLYCYANDIKGFYWNNFGQITLTMTRTK